MSAKARDTFNQLTIHQIDLGLVIHLKHETKYTKKGNPGTTSVLIYEL